MRKFSHFIIGALLGGLVGSILAILLAPSSGKDLRGQINETIQSTIDEVNQAGSQKRQELLLELQQLRTPDTADTTEQA